MIEGKLRTEISQQEYRKDLDRLHYSGLSLFEEDRMKFYKKYVLREFVEEKHTSATIIGSLTDFYLNPSDGVVFHDMFAESSVNRGGGQVFDLVDNLLEVTKQCLDENMEPTREFKDRFREAFDMTKYDGSGKEVKYLKKDWEKGLVDFKMNGEHYFNDLLNNTGKIVFGPFHQEKSKFIVEQLKSSNNTREIFAVQTDDNIQVYNQVNIFFEYRGVPFKAALDKVIVDHKKKRIRWFDLKTTYDNQNFGYAYIKNKYYLQLGVYSCAILFFMEEQGLQGYSLDHMGFVVADTSKNSMDPLVYTTNDVNVHNALVGFEYREQVFRGVTQLADGIEWAKENGIWKISKEAHQAGGIIPIQEFQNIKEHGKKRSGAKRARGKVILDTLASGM